MMPNGGEKIVVHIDADIEELIPGFFRNRREDVRSILSALKNEDYETIRMLGHTMKGSGGGYGFDKIAEIGYSFERAATDGNADELKKIATELSSYLERVEIAYD